MVGGSLSVLDAMDGSGGAYSQSRHAHELCVLFNLFGGAQRQPGR